MLEQAPQIVQQIVKTWLRSSYMLTSRDECIAPNIVHTYQSFVKYLRQSHVE
jgi:hypothetical protein